MKTYIRPHITVVTMQMQHLLAMSVHNEDATSGGNGGGSEDDSGGGSGLARRTIRQPNAWQEW